MAITRIPKSNALASTLYILLIFAIIYQMYAYVGPYKWMSEWQISNFGGYISIVSIFPNFVLVLLVGLIEPDHVEEHNLQSDHFDTYEEKALYESARAMKRIRPWLAVSFVLVIGSLVFWLTNKPSNPESHQTYSASSGGRVPVGMIDFSADLVIADTVQIETYSRNAYTTETYIPTEPADVNGAYNIIVARDDATAERSSAFDAFVAIGSGIGTMARGIDGEAATRFASSGIRVSSDGYTFTPGIPPKTYPELGAFIISFLLFSFIGIAFLLQNKKNNRARSDMAS